MLLADNGQQRMGPVLLRIALLLPALLLPSGMRFGLCLCPDDHREVRACASCCTDAEPGTPTGEDDAPVESWTCTDCYSVLLQQQAAKKPDSSAGQAAQGFLFAATALAQATIPGAPRVTPLTAARALAPPASRQSLPLRI